MYKRSDKASDHSGLDFVFFVLHLFQTLSYVTTTYIIKKRINTPVITPLSFFNEDDLIS